MGKVNPRRTVFGGFFRERFPANLSQATHPGRLTAIAETECEGEIQEETVASEDVSDQRACVYVNKHIFA